MSKKKSGNTPQYRQDKRVVTFVDKETKGKILASAKGKKISVSKEVRMMLEDFYA